jgi:hypothetical protein
VNTPRLLRLLELRIFIYCLESNQCRLFFAVHATHIFESQL